MRHITGTLLLDNGLARGVVEFDDQITKIEQHGEITGFHDNSASAPFITPGYIDVHVHGGGGGDTMDGPDGVLAMAAFHLEHGTTSILPTTMTNPWSAVLRGLDGVKTVIADQAAAGNEEFRPAGRALPIILGAHLEGPFISPRKLGAQPAHTLLPTADLVDEIVALDVVRVVTMAPEVKHAIAGATAFARAGSRVSVGHTVASFEQADGFMDAVWLAGGEVGFTHLYNAMSQLGSREPGVVGAALARSRAYAEVIFDLHHVHPASFLAAHAAKRGRLLLVTDAIRAAGTGDASSELGGSPVFVEDGAARLADGTLAGSVLTMDQAVRNAVGAGLELHEAVNLASSAPAEYLGLHDRGRLQVGRRADLVLLDANLHVDEVYVAGRRLD